MSMMKPKVHAIHGPDDGNETHETQARSSTPPIQKQEGIYDNTTQILKDISHGSKKTPRGMLRYEDVLQWSFDKPIRHELAEAQLRRLPKDVGDEVKRDRILHWLEGVYPEAEGRSFLPLSEAPEIPAWLKQEPSSEEYRTVRFHTEPDSRIWMTEAMPSQDSNQRGSFIKGD